MCRVKMLRCFSLVSFAALATALRKSDEPTRTTELDTKEQYPGMMKLAETYELTWSAPVLPRAHSGCPPGAFPDRLVCTGQEQEDIAMHQYFFWGKENGTFLELGAYTGARLSNTFMFERFLGWNGLLLEMNPSNYANVPHNRPRSIAVNAGATNGQPTRVEIAGRGGRTHLKTSLGTDAKTKGIWALPLRMVAEAAGFQRFDMISVDVEGHELQVLKGLGADILSRVGVLVVEMNKNLETDEQTEALDRWLREEAKLIRVTDKVPYGVRGQNGWYTGKDFVAARSPQKCEDGLQINPKWHLKGRHVVGKILGTIDDCPSYRKAADPEADVLLTRDFKCVTPE